MALSESTTSRSSLSQADPDTERSEKKGDARSLLSSLIDDDEKMTNDPELKEKIGNLLEALDGESHDLEMAEFIVWSASSSSDGRQRVALSLAELVPYEFGARQEECCAALKALIERSLESQNLRDAALTALPHYVKLTANHDIVQSLLSLQLTASPACLDDDDLHECPFCTLAALAVEAPVSLTGHLPAVAALFCEAAQAVPEWEKYLVPALFMVAQAADDRQVRAAFDMLIGRDEVTAMTFLQAFFQVSSPSSMVSELTAQLAGYVGRCLRSDDVDLHVAAAGGICLLANGEAEEAKAAAASLLPLLLEKGEMDSYGTSTYLQTLPGELLSHCATDIVAFCRKILQRPDGVFTGRYIVEQILRDLLEKSPTLDQAALAEILHCGVLAVEGPPREDEWLADAGQFRMISDSNSFIVSSIPLLCCIVSDHPERVSTLLPVAIEHAEAGAWEERFKACEILRACATTGGGETAVERLISLLLDPHAMVRHAAVDALRWLMFELKEKTGTVIAALICVLSSDGVGRVASLAARAIEDLLLMGETSSAQPILLALKTALKMDEKQSGQDGRRTMLKQVVIRVLRCFAKQDPTVQKSSVFEELKKLSEEWVAKGEVEEEDEDSGSTTSSASDDPRPSEKATSPDEVSEKSD